MTHERRPLYLPASRRTFLKQTGALALGGAFFGSCGGSSDQRTAKDGSPATRATPPHRPTGTLRIANPIEPGSLDPARASNTGDLSIVWSIYEGLVDWNDDRSELVPVLATEWSTSADGLEWSFGLRDGVVFHDGEPFDSDAFKASYDYYRADDAGLLFALLPDYREIDTRDPVKVRIVLRDPFPEFLRNQTFAMMISPKQAARGRKVVERAPVGTGAYRFSRYDRGRNVVLAAHTEYWDDGPYYERVEFPLVSDPTARVAGLQTEELEVISRVPPSQVRQLEGNDSYRPLSRDSWLVRMLTFQTKSSAVEDVRVRQALALAIDRQLIIDRVVLGEGTLIDSVVPPGVFGASEPATTYRPVPDRARQLLDEAGAAGATVRLASAPGSSQVLAPQIAQALADQWRQVGLEVDVGVLDDALLDQDIFSENAKYDMHINEFGYLTGGPLILQLGLVQAHSKWSPPEYEKTLAAAFSTADEPKRLRLIAELQEQIAASVPWLPLYQQRLTDFTLASVHGYTSDPVGVAVAESETFST